MKIQTLGLELRKINNVTALYNDVDQVLKNTSAVDIAHQTTAHVLQKMLKPDKWISICEIKECAKICGICIPAERLSIYQATHCMGWNEMTPEYRQLITAMILNDFRSILNPNG